MTRQADAARVFGDGRAQRKGVVDAFDAVFFHGQQEAAGELRARRACVKKRGAGVDEVLLAHKVVGLEGSVQVRTMDTQCHAHEHVLGPLNQLAVNGHQIALLQRLVAKILEEEVPIVLRAGMDDDCVSDCESV
jgi:hypothetical protein